MANQYMEKLWRKFFPFHILIPASELRHKHETKILYLFYIEISSL